MNLKMTGKENSNRFLLTLFGMQKAKSKVNRIVTVLIHAAGWCLLLFLPLLLYPVRINDNRFIIPELIDKSILIILFYLNYYVLIPRLFEKKKYVSYFSFTLLVFIIYLFQYANVRANYFSPPPGPFWATRFSGSPPRKADSLISPMGFINKRQVNANKLSPDSMRFGPGFQESMASDDSRRSIIRNFPPDDNQLFGIPKRIWLMTLNNAVSSFALLFLIGGFIRLAFSFIRNQNEKKMLENANLNAEVNFLKSQINPHFLFNTLNSIYSQAHSRSDKTEISILKLSELLRYVLYDSGEDRVEITKDIQYINNYIDLQKIRLSSKIKVNYSVNGVMQGCRIAPMLLIAFIENAFKHGISYSQASYINIEINIIDEILTLLVSNPVVRDNSFVNGGLGLKNVTRRLDLLYPGKYKLIIHQENNQHIVNLNLDLRNDQLLNN